MQLYSILRYSTVLLLQFYIKTVLSAASYARQPPFRPFVPVSLSLKHSNVTCLKILLVFGRLNDIISIMVTIFCNPVAILFIGITSLLNKEALRFFNLNLNILSTNNMLCSKPYKTGQISVLDRFFILEVIIVWHFF